jgi:hypothetical protein
MKQTLTFKFLVLLFTVFSFNAYAQEYPSDSFVGTWHGTISATTFGGYNDPITMTIYEDGFYTETSGRLMPTLYPNTQQFEYDAATNRLHWWYLDLVYAGQYFYQHFYYEIVYFDDNVLEAHYNFWDDPEPQPQAGIIYLVKEGASATPSPVNFDIEFINNQVFLAWDEPVAGGNPVAGLQGYNIFGSIEMGDYELLAFTEETNFLLSDSASAGLHAYYATAVYDQGESDPTDSIMIIFDTPEPQNLAGEPQTQSVFLEWEAPETEFGAVATLLGYNVFHKFDNGEFELAAFTQNNELLHENLPEGTHSYYVTAVYLGGESSASNEIEINLITTGIGEIESESMIVFPNPANSFVNVSSGLPVQNVKILNHSGQLVQSSAANSTRVRLDVSGISAGLYLMVLETEEGVNFRKLIIE